MSDILTTTQVLEAVPDLTYRQIDYWVRRGYIAPLDEPAGSGVYRRWDDGAVERLASVAGSLRLVKDRAQLHRRIIAGEIVVIERHP